MESSTNTKPHAVLVASPGMGHLIPVLELAKRFINQLNFRVTIIVVASKTSKAESEIINSTTMSSDFCKIIELPSPDVSALVNTEATVFTRIAVAMREIRPALRSEVHALNPRPTIFIVDLFGFESLPIAEEIGVPKCVYVATHAWFIALTVYAPVLDKLVDGEYVDQTEPFEIPGCMSVQPNDIIDPMLDRSNQQYGEYLRMGVGLTEGDAILVNTWEELQPTTLAALREDKVLSQIVKVPIYSVGPTVRPIEPVKSKDCLFDWLDNQPSESVLYVSFGSGGTLSLEQMIELAWGLELSKVRFVWVVRKPSIQNSDGSFFSAGTGDDDVSKYLPEGFLDRVREFGYLVSEWAPQMNILSHGSVGGFLTHSGWNSALECMVNGVPMIVWPLYAEQRMNATMLTEEIGVAIRPEVLPLKEIVKREEINMLVKKIMMEEEGSLVRSKAKELKMSAEKAWSDKDGSSYKSLSEFGKQWEISKSQNKTLNLLQDKMILPSPDFDHLVEEFYVDKIKTRHSSRTGEENLHLDNQSYNLMVERYKQSVKN